MYQDKIGLKHKEVEEKLKQYGPNSLPERPLVSNLILFLSQLKTPLVYVLLLASVVTFLIGHIPDAIIIFLSVLINTSLGFLQEKKANESFNALKKLIVQKAVVIRDGKRMEINSSHLVPGDLVVLSIGDKIPADGKILEANRLFIGEAIITGENIAVTKSTNDEIFMGTTVVSGQALMETTITGTNTRIGKIAREVQSPEEETPLTKQLIDFSRKLVVLILLLVIFVFAIGLLRGNSVIDMFITSVALAVSAIPEGLLVSMTAVLAIGMQRILDRKGLVRKLVSAETLGGVTTICVDKTGTLTEGKMQVLSYHGDVNNIASQMLVANDLDDPIVISAHEWAKTIIDKSLHKKRLDNLPFSSKERFSASLNYENTINNIIYVNGAPDILLKKANLSPKEKKAIELEINELTSKGRRLIGLARRKVPNKKTKLDIKDIKDLEWVGMLTFFDPIRPSVKDALGIAQRAGIKIIVITGDYPKTAKYVLAEIGLPVKEDEIVVGGEIPEDIAKIKLFARTTPDQKKFIVEALQQKGEVVAMMGDGVNDAQAIHKADIGIVVDGASDVAKESADLVLLDSNFSTIVAAIEEGRGIFDNIKKVIAFLISGAFAEIFVVVSSIVFDLPLPITAIQIIWINLVSDSFPSLALTIDPKRHNIMHDHPRSSKEKLINKWTTSLVAIVTLCAGIGALLTFIITLNTTSNISLSRSFAFVTLGFSSLTYVFSIRSLHLPVWKDHIFRNKWLIAAVAVGFILQTLPFWTPSFRNFFGVESLDLVHWLIAILISFMIFFMVEIFKFFGEKIK